MKKEKSQRNNFSSILIGVIILCAVITCLIIFFTTGKTTITTSTNGNIEFLKGITCESGSVSYPLFEYDSSKGKKLQINAIFKDNNLSSMSLTYKLFYDDKKTVDVSESLNHAAMNISFGQNGLNADALSATYGKTNDGLQMSIYATGEDLNGQTLKYFMLDNDRDLEEYSKENLAEIYSSKGLKCDIKNNEKQ